jgi:hypothetical protein
LSLQQCRDVANIRKQGFEVDNGNEPNSENVPPCGSVPSQGLKPGLDWGWDGIDGSHIILLRRKNYHMQKDGCIWVNHTFLSFFTSFLFHYFMNQSLSIQVKQQRASVNWNLFGVSYSDSSVCGASWLQSFQYHHAVDGHNNLHHELPRWEDIWVTKELELRVIVFVLGISKVNAFLAIRYALGNEDMPTLLSFCRKLGWQLILNPDLVEERVEHYQLELEGGLTLCCAPCHA